MVGLSDDVKEAFTVISERGVLGGIYLGSVGFSMVLSTPEVTIDSKVLPWAAGMCLLMGLVVASTTYEVLMPILRLPTNLIAERGFRNALRGSVTNKQTLFANYGQIRKFRELFLASEGSEHLKERIKKDEKLRQTLTYFATASLAALAVIYIADLLFTIDPKIKKINLGIVFYLLTATLVGQLTRSYSFGRAVGLAFVGIDKSKRQALFGGGEGADIAQR